MRLCQCILQALAGSSLDIHAAIEQKKPLSLFGVPMARKKARRHARISTWEHPATRARGSEKAKRPKKKRTPAVIESEKLDMRPVTNNISDRAQHWILFVHSVAFIIGEISF